ncbi:Sodium/hydrogen exchanger family-domain-containing protein [Multifurca ochricompacta]|uniref:Sodium/hydrogen exchanger family-domain-containing protein n=1 Tax=Multifurca ochricompacta TaxID=376703 RepID=A0AAD4LZI8_9AGAM|nr:Sodium/hydrogen exchanger family-domain-containing protein [Multifurca ochricompacta]
MSIHLGSVTVSAAAAAPVDSSTPAPPEVEEFYSSWSLFLVCLLLILSLWTSYYLQIKRIRAIHETVVSIVAGMVVGFVVRLAPGHLIREMLVSTPSFEWTFKSTLFFNLLLPPIILNSGYELKQESFFRNFGSILTFAFLGTFISAVGVGVLVYIWSILGIESLEFTLLECLIFGTTLSATDPVTILAIFKQYKVDPKLYTVIFGESLLNDADTSQFHGTEIYLSSLFHGIGIFLLSFSVSMALGVAFGLAMSLSSSTPHSMLTLPLNPALDRLASFLWHHAETLCLPHHVTSHPTRTKYIFGTLAKLSENFIFIYLGLSLFTSPPSGEKVTSYVKPLFIAITTVAVVFTRYAAVFPLSELINFFQRHARGQRTEELPHAYQMMLFWADATYDRARRRVLTVVIFGGTTAKMLEVLGIRTGVEDEDATSSDDDESPPLSSVRRGARWQRLPPPDDYYPGYGRGAAASRIGSHYGNPPPRSYNHHVQNQNHHYHHDHQSSSRSRSPNRNHHHRHQSQSQGQSQQNRSHNYNYNNNNQHQHQHEQPPFSPMRSGSAFSAASSDSYDSDGGEVLPLAPTSSLYGVTGRGGGGPDGVGGGGGGGAIDERYLLPLFSNATASRTFYARRMRRAGGGGVEHGEEAEEVEMMDDGGGGGDGDGPEVDLGRRSASVVVQGGGGGLGILGSGVDESRLERGLPSPTLRRESDPALSRSP